METLLFIVVDFCVSLLKRSKGIGYAFHLGIDARKMFGKKHFVCTITIAQGLIN
jgi:hypothetical protein